MTTGNKVVDDRVSYIDYYGSLSYHGRYKSKTWTGGDWGSTVKPSYTNVYTPGAHHPRRVYQKPPARAFDEEHPYQCVFSNQNRQLLSYTFRGPPPENKIVTVNLTPSPSLVVNSPWSTNDDLKLIEKLREAIVGSDFNAGVAIAESSKSFGLVANSATKIYLALKAARSGRVGDAARILTKNTAREGKYKPPTNAENKRSQWGSHWLELQYGWLPLLKDAHAAAKAIAQAYSVPPQKIYRVSRRVEDILIPPVGYSGSTTAYTQGTIKAIIREKNMPTLLGLTDPASIVWELMPYSFVVDWFIPIGGYLQNLALARGIEGTFVTTKYRYRKHSYYSMVAPAWPAFTAKPITFVMEEGDVRRTISGSLQVPTPAWVSIDKALSPKRCINAIALLTQMKF